MTRAARYIHPYDVRVVSEPGLPQQVGLFRSNSDRPIYLQESTLRDWKYAQGAAALLNLTARNP